MNKKGFTLIELLSVLAILALIALIATPIILEVLDKGRKGAAIDSMYMYVKAVENSANANSATAGILNGTYTTKEDSLYLGSNKVLEIKTKGTIPEDDGSVTMVDGDLEEATLKINGYVVIYKNKKAYVQGEEPPKVFAVGDIVYYDPTGAVTDCVAGKEWTSTNTSTTCYKWNVIKNSNQETKTVELLLNHNIGKKVAWNSSDLNTSGPKEVMNELKIQTANWTKVETMTNSDNLSISNNNASFTIDYVGMKAKLISAFEISDISGLSNWTPYDSPKDFSIKPWLSENLSASNTSILHSMYWTSTPHFNSVNNVWGVSSSNNMIVVPGSSYSTMLGVRPVVRVLKSNL